MDYQGFVDGDKTLLVAPAGYGKTHTIVESLKYSSGKQLILTHTHAGVSSLKEKIKNENIPLQKYIVETISSFSQRYVLAFCDRADIPDQEDVQFHSVIIKAANDILQSTVIQKIIRASYCGLFVDEYQDCTKSQHDIIMALGKVLPTHILGDPLQGIFDFNEELVDFETDLTEFEIFPELDTPNRWYKEGHNSELGDEIKEYREPLKGGGGINLVHKPSIGLYVFDINDGDFDNADSNYRKVLTALIGNRRNNHDYDSLLILVPEYSEFENGRFIRKGNITDRSKIITKIDFSNSVRLIEAIDDKSFYQCAKDIDGIIDSILRARKPRKKVYELLSKYFCKTSPNRQVNVGLNDWMSVSPRNTGGDLYVKNKNGENRHLSDSLSELIGSLISCPSINCIYQLICFVKNDLKLKRKPRRELLNSVMKSIQYSVQENTTVYDAMRQHKNIVRRMGRKVDGKCIGTTLLTKGLEFDTVVILDAHKFNCPKHLYVALTRCCKNLIIFTGQRVLPTFNR